jgi:murein DD-endopeptidase MepM/ murein hydrolase activator NlpD
MAGTSTDNPRTDAARERTGHDAPPARKGPVVGGRSIDKDARTRAYVAALQRDLNRHLVLLGSPTVLAVDGVWEHDTDVAFRRVCRVLGLEPKRSVRTFRAIGGAIAPPTAEELEKSRTDGAAYEKQLRHHFAHAPVPTPKPDPDPQPVGDAALEAALRKAGARYEREIVREAKRSGLPISLICAVLEVETGFRNVFGHDNVRNPIKSPPGGLLAVTPDLYRQYLGFRRRGLGNQGVGPMQLTSPGLQDRADALGGCSKVGPNIRVGVEFLAGNIRRLGLFGGVAAYNGSNAYATKVRPLEKTWRAKLAGAGDGPSSGGSGPRTLRVGMEGSDVLALQKLVNQRFAEWKVGLRIAEDGDFGPDTRKAVRRVAYGLGAATAEYGNGITPALRSKLRRPSRRTTADLARARRRRPWLRKLRAANSNSGTYPLGVHGPIIGTPYHGTHTRGNWQSDNALDIRVPDGTPVIALADGVIVKTYKAVSGVTAGWQVTLRGASNAWFYGHLSTVSVKAGDRVRKGQTIGTSGSASGVPHLHIGQQLGRPDFH